MWVKERELMKFGKPIAILLIVCFVASLAATTVSSKASTGSKGDKNMAIQNIKVFSNAFESNSTIPKKYTCSGENINPPLELGGIPKEAKSLVLKIKK
jgi:phosphatidylethanolamine-binding protein (PEBP) family uncharacterized protein